MKVDAVKSWRPVKWMVFVFVALIFGSTAMDQRDTQSPESWRVIFDIIMFAVLWAGLFFSGALAFRLLRKLWRWAE